MCCIGEDMTAENSILDLIKQSGAMRKFNGKPVPDTAVDTIFEAAIWSLSILGVQPWYYVYLANKEMLNDIAKLLSEQARVESGGVDKIMAITAEAIRSSYSMIAIYNNKVVQNRAKRLNPKYVENAHMAELQGIGACVQNIILTLTALGLKCVWVNTPTYVKDEVNKILCEDKELLSCLLIGCSDLPPIRSKRQAKKQIYRVIR